ncbi:MAG: MarR family transcriptional regulator [Steroidobacteraceae bacterium]
MSEQHYQASTYDVRNSVGYLVKRTYALMLDALEPAFIEHGFTYMQYVVLMQLRSGAVLNPRNICADFRHDSGALTRVIDQLADRGLVERSRSEEDRRKVNLHLTPAGLATCEELIPLVVDRLNAAVGDFSRTELDELIRLLGKFVGGMERELARAGTTSTPVAQAI